MTRTLVLYGTAHAAVDAGCAALVIGLLAVRYGDPATASALIVLYNLLAFGLEPLLALPVDRKHSARQTAAAGCALTGVAMVIPGSLAVAAICLAGVGNALFHIGAGSIVLQLRSGSAAPAGIFVAPGGIGLFLGMAMAGRGFSAFWAGGLVLCALSALLLAHKAVVLPRRERPRQAGRFKVPILALLLCSVAMRSLTGMAMGFSWQPPASPLWLLVLAAALGKAFGGVFADRFGWMRIGAGAPLVATLLVLFGGGSRIETVLAVLLVAATMPVALAAVAEALPREPAFAFGLTAFALLAGGLPIYGQAHAFFSLRTPLAAAVLLCCLTMYCGLRLARPAGRSTGGWEPRQAE